MVVTISLLKTQFLSNQDDYQLTNFISCLKVEGTRLVLEVVGS
jgi:hypothetical protein